jgi:NADPH2:quinone reductase
MEVRLAQAGKRFPLVNAVWYSAQGDAAMVLQFGEQPTPSPKAGELRVRLVASATNPADCNRRRGNGYPMEFPLVITNSDGAGVVDAVGDGVDAAWLGQRVWLYNGQRGRALGTAAEYIALDEKLVMPLPEGTDFSEGACLGIPCMTAYRCVFLDGPVEGKTLLVSGGAGAVGHYAIQLARWGGARVVATVSSDAKRRHAARAGAQVIVNYRDPGWIESLLDATDGVDRIVEVDFGGNLAANVKLLRPNGVIAAYASRGEANPVLPFYELMRKNATVHGVMLPGTPPASRREAQREINRWLGEGRAVHTIAARFPLRDTALAHLAVERGDKLGTVVIQCDAAG